MNKSTTDYTFHTAYYGASSLILDNNLMFSELPLNSEFVFLFGITLIFLIDKTYTMLNHNISLDLSFAVVSYNLQTYILLSQLSAALFQLLWEVIQLF
jgi:hypothetical protein